MGTGTKQTGIERYDGPDGTSYTARASKRLPNGERIHWRDTFRTLQEAVKARREWLVDHDHGTAVAASRVTLKAACQTWLDTFLRTKAATTAAGYRRTIEAHILPSRLAGERLQSLDTGRIQAWYNGLGVGVRTLEVIHLRLCQILDMAIAHGLLRDNPARRASVPKSRPKRGVALTHEQAMAFLAVAATDTYTPFWHVSLATGLRRGEVLGLRWQDVDLAAGVLTVRQTVVWIDRPIQQDRTKTPSSARTVQIKEETIAKLRQHAQDQRSIRDRAGDKWENHDLVFCTRHGKPLSGNNLHTHFKALLEAAGLDTTIKIHDLRHSHLSYLLNNGVPITAVARRGGYRNPHTLLQTYAHADLEQDQLAADVAEGLTSPFADGPTSLRVAQ